MKEVKVEQVRDDVKNNKRYEKKTDGKKAGNGRRGQLWAIIGSIVALAIFLFVAFSGSDENEPAVDTGKVPVSAVPRRGNADLKRIISERTATYLAQNSRTMSEFEQKLATAGQADFTRAFRNVNGTVDQLSGFGVTSKLCYKMAKDRLISGSHDTSDALMSIMKDPIIGPCSKGCVEIEAAYRDFAVAIEENRNRYFADLAQYGRDRSTEAMAPGEELLTEHLLHIGEKICVLESDKLWIVIGLGVEAVFLKSSLRSLALVCGHIVGKLAGSASTGAICAVADGPLPIGDVIGAVAFAGGIAWSAWDIYQVCSVMPGEIRTSMQKMIRECEQNARNQALEAARRLTAELEKEAIFMQDEMKKETER